MLFLLGRTSEEVFVVSSFHFCFIFISFSFQFFDFHFIRAMLLLLGTTFEEVFVVSSFHFWSSFVHVLYLSMFFISFTFRHHPSSFHGLLPGFFHPFYTFSTAHRKVIRDTFSNTTVLSGRLPAGVFYLTLLHRHFWFMIR